MPATLSEPGSKQAQILTLTKDEGRPVQAPVEDFLWGVGQGLFAVEDAHGGLQMIRLNEGM
jgi:hypothetical protein